MKARSVLTLLVVLALSLALFMTTAGSAVHREVPSAGPDPVGVVVLKGEGGDTNGGDDDRWGRILPTGDEPGAPDASGGPSKHEGEGAVADTTSARFAPSAVRIEVGMFFRTMLIFLCVR